MISPSSEKEMGQPVQPKRRERSARPLDTTSQKNHLQNKNLLPPDINSLQKFSSMFRKNIYSLMQWIIPGNHACQYEVNLQHFGSCLCFHYVHMSCYSTHHVETAFEIARKTISAFSRHERFKYVFPLHAFISYSASTQLRNRGCTTPSTCSLDPGFEAPHVTAHLE